MKRLKFLMISIFIYVNLSFVNAQIQTGVFKTPSGNTDYHHFVRNHASGAAVYINQVSTGPILRLSSGLFTPDQGVKFTFENNGYFGIGTNTVTEKLVLYKTDASQVATQYGNLNTGTGTGNGFVVGIESVGNGIIWNRENNFIRFGTNAIERMRINANGNVGIGSINPNAKLHIVQNSEDYSSGIKIVGSTSLLSGRIWMGNDKLHIDNATAGTETGLTLIKNGKVGIGTTTPDAKLTVKGNIHAEEVKVDLLVPAPDYVFKADYNLRTLEETQNYINEHGHLPNIPSAKEMKENGIELGEMNMKLLEKIEELTLYTLQQQEEIKELRLVVNNLLE